MPYSRGWPVALYAHPFELALATALVVNGVRGFIGGLSPSIGTLPPVVLYFYLIVSTVGGVGLLVGLLAFKPPINGLPRFTGPRIERASLFLVAASYAVLAIMILAVAHTAGISTALTIALFAGACILRALAIRKAATIIIDRLGEAREAREDS